MAAVGTHLSMHSAPRPARRGASSELWLGRPRLVGRPWADRPAAELLRRHVRHRLRQLPTMSGQSSTRPEVTLAVQLPVDRCLDHESACVTGPNERGVHIGNPNPDRVGGPTRRGQRSPPTSATITAQSPSSANWARWLSPIRVRSTKPKASARNATAARTPGSQDGHDRGRWNRTVGLHLALPPHPAAPGVARSRTDVRIGDHRPASGDGR